MAIKYIPGKGRSISVRTNKPGDYLFRSFLQRDACCSLLLKRCEALEVSVQTTKDNKPDDFSEHKNKKEQQEHHPLPPPSSLSPPLCPPSPLHV
mmetsp:Transcript_31734/g.49633  ORF Transcript_31734/g.49633 Transcript_31734/m.49633 type:complete len:94 (-) Transcript_31734:79-360(-)